MKPSQTRVALMLLLIALTATSSGCGVINGIRAKNELNEGAGAYKAGKFVEAQQHFERALELDPGQQNAPIFIARSIHAQYRPGVLTPENIDKAKAAIAAYQKVITNDPSNDDAFNAVAYLYRQIKEEDSESKWLMARANLESAPKEKRSDAFTVLASKRWNCSFEITEQKDNKATVMKDGKPIIQFKKGNPADIDKARGCAMDGLKLVEQAISLNPDNESAWSYKTNLLREMAKFAEMENNTEEKAKYEQQATQALERNTELNKQNKLKKEAEAKQSPAATS